MYGEADGDDGENEGAHDCQNCNVPQAVPPGDEAGQQPHRTQDDNELW